MPNAWGCPAAVQEHLGPVVAWAPHPLSLPPCTPLAGRLALHGHGGSQCRASPITQASLCVSLLPSQRARPAMLSHLGLREDAAKVHGHTGGTEGENVAAPVGRKDHLPVAAALSHVGSARPEGGQRQHQRQEGGLCMLLWVLLPALKAH